MSIHQKLNGTCLLNTQVWGSKLNVGRRSLGPISWSLPRMFSAFFCEQVGSSCYIGSFGTLQGSKDSDIGSKGPRPQQTSYTGAHIFT